jgi:hypothetical protein
MKQAIEANREDQRRLEAFSAAAKSSDSDKPQSKKAIAFEINLGGDGPSRRPSVGPTDGVAGTCVLEHFDF